MEDYRLEQTGAEVQEILNNATPQADLTAETERAQLAEQGLAGDIHDEELRAKAAEEANAGAIHDEELRAKAAEEQNAGAIASINEKIPSGASSENKLADVDFVNSSISTATATYRGSFNLVSDLHLAIDATHAQIETLLGTVISVADKNDYCYVQIPTSAETPTQIASVERYKFTTGGWTYEYTINNSGFTAAQWAAINSGITSGLVAKLGDLPTATELSTLLAGKQNTLTFDNVPTQGSANPVKSGGVYSAIDDEKGARVNNVNTLQGEIDGIEGKIPAAATSENKLVDEAKMNSAIATATATFRGSYNIVTDLGLAVTASHEQIAAALAGAISTSDNNDYAFVMIPTSAETPTQIASVERYKNNGEGWGFEYALNNSGFTSAQWAALNSGITSGLVAKLGDLPTATELTALLAGKQDTLTFDNVPTQDSANPVKSGGVYTATKNLSDAIEAILLLIPSAASSLNKLVDNELLNSSIATATATFRGTYNLVSDLHLGIDATHIQVANALASAVSDEDNNDYAFVQIPTSAESPTQIAQTDRYKFNGTAWAFEYTLNVSGFTSAQWAAINSEITAALVTKLSNLPTASELTTALGLLGDDISAINQKIPSTATQSNKLVDESGMNSFVALALGAIDATFNVQSTDGHVTLHITQVDGEITSVEVQTTDIASAAALTLVTNRVTTAEGQIATNASNITTLQNLYNSLQQSAPQVIQPTDTWPVANPSTTVIYRVIDRVNTPPQYYSDYMWNGTTMVLMATYNNAIDDEPTAGSDNLVKSGGVYEKFSELYVDSSILFDYKENVPYQTLSEKNIFGGQIGQLMTRTSNNSTLCYKVDVSSYRGLSICVLTYTFMTGSNRGLVLTDENEIVISKINEKDPSFYYKGDEGETGQPYNSPALYLFEIPQDAKYLYISLQDKLKKLKVFSVKIKKDSMPTHNSKNFAESGGVYDFVMEKIALPSIGADVDKVEIVSIVKNDGYYRHSGGTIIQVSGYFYSNPVEVNKGDIFIAYFENGFSNDAVLPICRVDSSNNFISPRFFKSDANYKYYKLCCTFDGYISFSGTSQIVVYKTNSQVFQQTDIVNTDISYLSKIDVNNPLQIIRETPGYAAIFRNWGFIGDSLSSGEMECYNNGEKVFIDMYEYSWGQQLCRLCGAEGYNFSVGGQTTRGFIEGSSERRWGGCSQNPKQVYTIAFGVNDINVMSLGDVNTDIDLSDYNNNANTFAGNYAGIIQRLKSIQPKCRIFVITVPSKNNATWTQWNDVIRSMATLFTNVYVIDLEKYAPDFSSNEIRQLMYLNGHMSPSGYLYVAYMLMTYIDWIVRNNPVDFQDISLIGTDYEKSLPNG